MPAITIGKLIAPRVHPQRWCNNGMVVDYAIEGRLRNALNQVAKWHGKTLFRSPGKLLAPASANVASRARWRARGHTGPLTEQLAVIMTLTTTGSVVVPDLFGRCAVTEVGGATSNVDFYYGNDSSSSGNVPAHHSRALFLVPVNPDMTYEFAFTDNGTAGGGGGACSRLVSASIHELKLPAHTLNGYLEPGVAVGLPIYDSHRSVAFALARDLWKQGGAACANFPADTDAEERTRTSGTFVNYFDDSSTSGGPSFKLDLRNRNRRSKDTVPMVLAAFGSIPSGSASIRLVGATSGVITAVSIDDSSEQWFETAFDCPAIEEEHRLLYASDGSNEVSVKAVSLYELDAT